MSAKPVWVCNTAQRATAYAPPATAHAAVSATMVRRGGRVTPSNHASAASAGATAAFSLLKSPHASATPLHTGLSRTTALYTARRVQSAAMSSPRPTTFATASTWTGCTAKSKPAMSPARAPAQRRASAATVRVAATCHKTFTRWNQGAPSRRASSTSVATVSGR